ncbi:helix-turn-helix domain-containing protein [Gordonia iterans]
MGTVTDLDSRASRSPLSTDRGAVAATLTATRERRGLTAKQVADALGRSPSYVSRAESGDGSVSGADLTLWAQVLDVTEELLCTVLPQEPPEGVHFRSQAVTKRLQDRLIQHANFAGWMLNRLHEDTLATAVHPRSVPQLDVDLLDEGPEEAAQLVRKAWRLHGPVSDVAGLLESAGIMILPMPSDVDKVDAISVRTAGPVTAVILLNPDTPEDRQRHTLAHELGHLVMDELSGVSLGLKEIENRADRFAAEFLAPYGALRDELRGITPARIDALDDLRRRWGVSLSALVRRAHVHADITESQYRYWFRTLNARNLLRDKRRSTYPVRPQAAAEFLTSLRSSRYAVADIAAITATRPRELQDVFGASWPFPRLRPQLSSV